MTPEMEALVGCCRFEAGSTPSETAIQAQPDLRRWSQTDSLGSPTTIRNLNEQESGR